jgi:hypothetical protein
MDQVAIIVRDQNNFFGHVGSTLFAAVSASNEMLIVSRRGDAVLGLPRSRPLRDDWRIPDYVKESSKPLREFNSLSRHSLKPFGVGVFKVYLATN